MALAILPLSLTPAVGQQSALARMQAHKLGDTPYRLFVPEDYRADRAYPLVLFLHGGGGRGTDNVSQLGEGNGMLVELFLERQDSFAAFVVAPQTHTSHDVQATLRIVDLVQKQYRIDPRRVYVIGQSLGGMAAVEIVAARPRMFAAAVIIAAAMPTRFARTLAFVPLWFFHGERDTVFPIEDVRALAAAVRKEGGRAKLTEYKGEGHGLAWLVVRERGMVPWLFAHERFENRAADSIVTKTLAIPQSWRTDTSVLPVSYLSDLRVDPSWQLSPSQRAQLARLVARAYLVSIEEYKQDYILDTRTALWQLIAANYPGADALVGEGGVFLGKLTKFLSDADSGGT